MEDILKRVVEIKREIKAKEEEVKKLKEQYERYEYELVNEMKEKEIDKISWHGTTVYLTKQLSISLPKDSENAVNWLIEHGYSDILKLWVNPRTLTAVLREEVEKDENLKEQLKEVFNLWEKERVGIRKL